MSEPPTFAGSELDRAGAARRDPAWVAARLADPGARALVLTTAGVHVEEAAAGLVPALVALEALGDLAGSSEPALLGLTPTGVPVLAVDADGADPDALAAALAPATLAGVRDAAARLSSADAGLVAYATSLLAWHRRHRFCANCGAPTDPAEGGHVRGCARCGAQHHPRTDPVAIMLVTDGPDRVLLGRQPTWPAGRYSALAGFVEPGESAEAAVAREVLEEAGVQVGTPRYVVSQPWPFPSSLMLGFVVPYASGEAEAADGELDDARWFSRAELTEAVAERGPHRVPPPLAIARRLIDGWLDGEG